MNRAPGLRDLALGELRPDRLDAMLREQESLFVEHKGDIARGEGFQLAKAAASFANTMGGWILVGVKGGSVDPRWKPPRGEFVDAVRQRLEGNIDPLPSFAAAVIEARDAKVGVVRVYESADTPHVLSDGSIVVREPAQDSKLRKRGHYEATPIASHYELIQLAQRGERARQEAEARFGEGVLPLIEDALGLRYTTAASAGATWRTLHARGPALVLRLAPLTMTRRWRDWPVLDRTVVQLSEVVGGLVDADEAPKVTPHPRGFAVTARSSASEPWTPGAKMSVRTAATVAADAAGALGLRLAFHLTEGSGLVNYHRPIESGEELREWAATLVEAAVTTLAAGEHLGRYAAHFDWLNMGDLYRRRPDYPNDPFPPGVIPGGGELTVSGPPGGGTPAIEIRALTQQWAHEFCRACGIEIWLTGDPART